MKYDDFLTTMLTKKIRYTVLIALILSVLALLFVPVILPDNISYLVGIVNFLNKYSAIFFIVLFISFFLFIAQLVSDIYESIQTRKRVENIRKIQIGLYDDQRVWNILLKLYYANGVSVPLVRSNQHVLLLEQYFMISRTSDTTFFYGDDLSTAEFNYVLQPETEKYIRNKLNE